MTNTMRSPRFSLGLSLLFAITVGCSSSHTGDGTDGGRTTTPRADGAIDPDVDGAIDPGTDGSVDPDRDGGSPADGSIVVGPDGSTRPTARVGTPCDDDTDCPGLFCSRATGGFGYCSWLCGESEPCPGDAVCAMFGDASYGYCMDRCDPAAPDCAVGYLCQPGVAPAPVCYPGCTDDDDCTDGRRCGDGISGVRQCYTPEASVGDPCALSEECPESGYCLDEASWGAPRGLCVTYCDLSSGAGCSGDTTCVAWGFMSGAGSCIPTCDASRPCRDGYECVATESGTQACVARCSSDADCSPAADCNFVTGRCG